MYEQEHFPCYNVVKKIESTNIIDNGLVQEKLKSSLSQEHTKVP